jgi:hypothetical protein
MTSLLADRRGTEHFGDHPGGPGPRGEPSDRRRLVGHQRRRNLQPGRCGGNELAGLVAGIGMPTGMIHPQHRQRAQHAPETELRLVSGVAALDLTHRAGKAERRRAPIPDRTYVLQRHLAMCGGQPADPPAVVQLSVESESLREPTHVRAEHRYPALIEQAHHDIGAEIALGGQDQHGHDGNGSSGV